jgi:hypothetical protein
MAIVPVMLEAEATAPTTLAPEILVTPDPSPLVRRSRAGKFVRLAAFPLVARALIAVLAASALVATKTAFPTVVAPRFCLASEALVAPVPPLILQAFH